MPHSYHLEKHYISRSGWLRAAVLGANDGIISVTSLVVGMAASWCIFTNIVDYLYCGFNFGALLLWQRVNIFQ